MTAIWLPSPNFDSREGAAVDMLVLHYTGMPAAEDALQRLADRNAKVSAHYVVDEDGAVYRLVEERDRAWHAGVSCWRGQRDINRRSIGVEIVNPGHEFGYRPFPARQMHSVAALCHDILSRHAVPACNVVGHSDIAPARKEDPGELFDWPFLAGHGIGLWPAGEEAAPEPPEAVRTRLETFGYDSDAPLDKVITAFQRRFRPAALTGEWDAQCQGRLESLLGMV